MSDAPGLISRKIVTQDDETVTFREIWDPRAPGCPFVVIDDVVQVDRTFTMAALLALPPGARGEHRAGPWHDDDFYDHMLMLGKV